MLSCITNLGLPQRHIFCPVNENMVGMKKAEAGSEIPLTKKKKKTPQVWASVNQEELEKEWTGISS